MANEKKFRVTRCLNWPDDGHRVNLYVNGYINVPVRSDKFKDYIAAGLEGLAQELRADAANERSKFLQERIVLEPLREMTIEERKEILREEKDADKEQR